MISSKGPKTLFDVAVTSDVHQIILSNSAIDKTPDTWISNLKLNFLGAHTLWQNEMILDLLKTNYDSSVLDAYNSIKPLAYKADLARYCIIHSYGGWYFDLFVKIKNINSLKNFSNDINFIFFREIPVPPFGVIYSAVNTLFWVKDRHNPILEKTIETVVNNVNSRKYTNHPFAVTGPMVFGREISNYQLKTDDSSFLVGDTQLYSGSPVHGFNDINSLNFMEFSERRAIHEDISDQVPSGYERHPDNYYKMWLDHDIFN